ncbi:MAG: amino acid adenylation domain-containing protein, partial [Oscillospiraceae bacterium]|nr:amino acid adenylation domain-containing protein [Oscillospiraceae bacterium]
MGKQDMLSQEDRAKLDSFNQTEAAYDDTQTIVSLFARAASAHPDNAAVIYRENRYTYSELDRLSDAVAACCAEKGLGRGDVVSILIPRGEYEAIASLGALKAGCAYQPLDDTYPEERLNFMVGDSGAKLLITTGELSNKITDFKGERLLLSELKPADKKPELPEVMPDDLFILLYTSGSTGTPKGVRLTHRNMVCFVNWYHRYYDLSPEDCVGQYASYGFDACMMDMYPALTMGAALCIIPEEIRLDLFALNAYMEKNRVTHQFMTTQVGRLYAMEASEPFLRHLSVGGEKLAAMTPPSGFAFHNGYGPTECTIFTTAYRMTEYEEDIPIGKPLDNVRLYVVDAEGNRLPPGETGELWVAGPHVGDGYLNRPDKTAEVFLDNPFDDDPKYKAVYRTGDLVYYREDGNLMFAGRADGQVKIRGFRVELSEVEAVVREFPGVRDATVAAFDSPSGGKYIAAYVTGDGEIDVHALHAFIAGRKPPYMVPAATMQLDAIPLTVNQKVDKRALPKPELKPRTQDAAPMNALERELHGLVSEIVGTSDFGVTDPFVELGLSSISAIHLATAVYKKYGVSLRTQELVSSGCIQSVENEILRQGGGAERTEKKETARSCRLSFAQQGVYVDCLANPDSVRYNLPFALTLPDGIGAEQLESAVRKVIAAHPYLLCRFVPNSSNEIVQEPIPDFELEIPVTEAGAAELEARKKAFVRPFDLAAGPMLRFEIVRSDALTLLVDMHHLISDGASVDLFFEQLAEALDGNELERETYDYYDYVAEESLSPAAEEFFAGQLAAMEDATQLIPDVFEEDLPHTEKSVSIPTELASVKTFAQRSGVTPAAVYLAAVLLTCGRYVCEDTAAIATISNGRSNMKISGTMGMFVNTLPIVTALDNAETAESFLRRVAKTFSDTIDHERYPFARIAAKYDFRPAVSYAYQIGVMSEYRTKYGAIAAEALKLDIAKLPVALYIDGAEDAAQIRVEYDSSMYSERMMQGLAESIENAVRGLMSGETLSAVSLTGETQWKTLDGFNAPWDLDYDKADTAVSVFRRNAKAQPDKEAAVFKDKSYTYRELDELTDALAAKLYRRACEVTGKTSLAEEVVA